MAKKIRFEGDRKTARTEVNEPVGHRAVIQTTQVGNLPACELLQFQLTEANCLQDFY